MPEGFDEHSGVWPPPIFRPPPPEPPREPTAEQWAAYHARLGWSFCLLSALLSPLLLPLAFRHGRQSGERVRLGILACSTALTIAWGLLLTWP